MVSAHVHATASTLAPLRYLAAPLSMIVGILFFDEVLTASFLLGPLIVVLTTHYIVVRENVRKAARPE